MITLCCNCKYFCKAKEVTYFFHSNIYECEHQACYKDLPMDPRTGYIGKTRIAYATLNKNGLEWRCGIKCLNNDCDCKYFEQKKESLWQKIKSLLKK